MWPVCGLYVACMWPVCGLYVACMWPVCGLHVACMWPACGLHVACMWPVCGLYVACMWPVCGLYVACMWPVCGLYVASHLILSCLQWFPSLRMLIVETVMEWSFSTDILQTFELFVVKCIVMMKWLVFSVLVSNYRSFRRLLYITCKTQSCNLWNDTSNLIMDLFYNM